MVGEPNEIDPVVKEKILADMAEARRLHFQAADYFQKKNNPWMAFDLWMQAIELDPYTVDYRLNIGAMCIHLGKPFDFYKDLALGCAVTASRIQPNRMDVWMATAEYSINASKYPEAITALEQALMFEPNNARLWVLKSFCHQRNAQKMEAYDCAEQAIKLDPEMGEAHFLIAYNSTLERFDPLKMATHGEKAFRAQKPCNDQITACWQSAHGYLNLGDYVKGFEYFEARFRLNALFAGGGSALARFKQPRWRGEKNRTVLIHPEMGFGDSFLMLRYLRVVTGKFNTTKIIFECFPQMIDLVRYNFPDIDVREFGSITEGFDYHLPMMSLPHYCKTRSNTVPWEEGGYLKAELGKIEEWSELLREKKILDTTKLNIGICWSGGKRAYNSGAQETDKRRSVPFELVKPLLAMPGINWISLQAENDSGLPNPGIQSFSDTAAIIHMCEAVVSVDTSVINLAGAMGKKTWLLNRYDHCWRWGVPGAWYPTIKDICQTHYGVWDDVIDKIKNELADECDKIAA